MTAKTHALEVIDIEIASLQHMKKNLDDNFNDAIDSILESKGRLIICGMGKSGIIGRKISASLSSTGTFSFFMHPGEAFHGDLGMVKSEDTMLLISNSGETEEVLKILPFLKDNKNLIISMTGNAKSSLAVASDYHLDVSVLEEACPLNLAPTTSTTATLVMGDAITVALMKKRNFKPEHYARYHPGGSLGKKLLSKVKHEMFTKDLPFVSLNATLVEMIDVITRGNLGLCIVEDAEETKGLVTDGDLRRALKEKGKNAFELIAKDILTANPLDISADASMEQAFNLMECKKITSLLVKEKQRVVGVIKK
ncbi:arabinose-5-phosphate isomerase [Paraphotobacterium marinum]|uniref:Arabinose 5-phosphate isomerase n=1 Tax=Paraphotobacterium marinum TaxID=1755811 RepID=A0A220VF13_9GAMM|nr:KpsF/GutQ family sugar-phosphate isomerase [Paraphotobacterium marinum]ASK78947.1 arabinose-5-phosphate isomerase [Paraphotobacterium marinum]